MCLIKMDVLHANCLTERLLSALKCSSLLRMSRNILYLPYYYSIQRATITIGACESTLRFLHDNLPHVTCGRLLHRCTRYREDLIPQRLDPSLRHWRSWSMAYWSCREDMPDYARNVVLASGILQPRLLDKFSCNCVFIACRRSLQWWCTSGYVETRPTTSFAMVYWRENKSWSQVSWWGFYQCLRVAYGQMLMLLVQRSRDSQFSIV